MTSFPLTEHGAQLDVTRHEIVEAHVTFSVTVAHRHCVEGRVADTETYKKHTDSYKFNHVNTPKIVTSCSSAYREPAERVGTPCC